jgi:hypothetical protein
MDKEYLYHDLPYPFPYVPAPGEVVTTATISEVILPLLETVQCVLETFGEAGQRGDLTNAYLGKTLGILAGNLELAISLLERLGEAGEEGKDEP